jgi:hypothetical protein
VRALNAPRKNRFRIAASILLAGGVLCSAFFPAAASAGRYEVVDVCRFSREGLSFIDEEVAGEEPMTASDGFRVEDRCHPDEDGSISIVAESTTQLRGGKAWFLAAPLGAAIRRIQYERILQFPWNSEFTWFLRDGPESALDLFNSNPLPAIQTIVHEGPTLDALAIKGGLACTEGRGFCVSKPGVLEKVTVRHINLTLEDSFAPEFTDIGGPLLSDDFARGTQPISYSAFDFGGGVSDATLLIDSVRVAQVHDGNGGACFKPYTALAPCQVEPDASIPVDTTRLSDGPHEAQIVLVDVAGNQVESPIAQFLVHNAPIPTGAPEISGSARVGSQLRVSNGTWDGNPTSFSYQWLRCPSTAERISDCAPIAGATKVAYVPTKADLSSRALAAVTARNASGSENAFSDATTLVGEGGRGRGGNGKSPVLSGVRLSRKRFHVLGGAHAGARGIRGAVLRFSSSDAGRLLVGITPAKGKSKRPLILGRKIQTGPGKLRITGHFGRRSLRPGRYRLLAFATDTAGNTSKPVQLTFTVLAG